MKKPKLEKKLEREEQKKTSTFRRSIMICLICLLKRSIAYKKLQKITLVPVLEYLVVLQLISLSQHLNSFI